MSGRVPFEGSGRCKGACCVPEERAVVFKTQIGYDYRGYRISLKDPNLGKPIVSEYNAYGQLKSETNARGQATVYEYDVLGRVVKETRPEGVVEYQYGTEGTAKNRIETIKKDNAVVQAYTYDAYGNVLTDTETIDGVAYTNSYSYDELLRLKKRISPSGLKLEYSYNENGQLFEVNNGESNTLLWRLDSVNATGTITKSTLGNNLTRRAAYNYYDLLTTVTLKNGDAFVDNMVLAFDSITGNLKNRNDITNALNEQFEYDKLNRLTGLKLGNNTQQRIDYHANGNIDKKFDVGTYQYGNNNHALSGVTNAVTGYKPNPFTISYNSANRVASLTMTDSTLTTPNKEKRAQFTYGHDNERRKMQYYEANTLKYTRYYIGSYEKKIMSGGTTSEIDYIYLPDGEVAVSEKTGTTRTLRYVHTDHLGSFRTVTNSDKSVAARYSYDAWGVRSLRYGTETTQRGYTGHEHLGEFGLINMNARLYDPVLGRFMGMDPYVQMPDNTQNFNRYSYALNNPLIYTDPSGEFIFSWIPVVGPILDAMCWGAVIGAMTSSFSYAVGATISGNWSKDSYKKAVGMGIFGGALGGGFSALGTIGLLESFGNTIGYNILTQTGSSVITNTMFGNDLTWGSAAGIISGGVFGAVLPGFNGVNGGRFVNGLAEMGFNSVRTAFTGFVSGLTQAGIDRDPSAIWQNTAAGAINGLASSLAVIATFGAAIPSV
ncbi:MAG: hypothetical protein PUB21_05040, partial [Bacteroidales bacterium]|nr:hypothetical protein [Bacteroidales bacterium]